MISIIIAESACLQNLAASIIQKHQSLLHYERQSDQRDQDAQTGPQDASKAVMTIVEVET